MTTDPGRGALAVLPILAVVLAACDSGAPPAASGEYDSAGVAIVASSPDVELPEWTLAEPSVTLGGMGAGPEYELYQAGAALRLADGRIVVANGGTLELRFYAPDGRFVAAVGGQGGGPGEYQALQGLVRLRGDSLGAWDWRSKRLTIYDTAGAFARVLAPTDAGPFFPRLLGPAPGGDSFILMAGFNPGDAVATGGGRWQDSRTLLRVPLDGGPPDSIGPFPGAEQFVELGEGSLWLRQVPFGRAGHVVVGGGRVFVGDDRAGEIRVHDGDGGLLRVIRTNFPTREVTDADIAAYRERELEDVDPGELPEMRRRLEKVPGAERTPAFDDLFADRLGRAWVAEFTDPAAAGDAPRAWTVFDSDGHPVARLTLPRRARPVDAGEDYVLLHTRDELDVERLELRSIRQVGS